MLFPFRHHSDWSVHFERWTQFAAFGYQAWRHNMRPAEDVLDRAFVHLHPRCHQSGIPVQYPEHGQNGHVSDVEETQLSLNLVQRQERFTFDFDLDHSLLLGPQLVNELLSGGVRVQDPLSDGFCLLLRQLV